MEFLVKIAQFIHALNKKEFEKYLIATLVGIALLTGAISYYIYTKSSALLVQIKTLENLANKSAQILADNQRVQQQEDRFKQMLEKDPDFTINGFFEKFCRDMDISPETGWVARSETITDKMDEISIPATFKGQTTEKLVKVLDALVKKEMVYTKELRMRSEPNKKITFDITIATNRYKTESD